MGNKDSKNWLDQNSYKVTGKYFFAEHIKNIKTYLISYCNAIDNISEIKRTNIINYSSVYFAIELLSSATRYRQSREQPLIRYKTLVFSKELQEAFQTLYYLLILAELKKIVKRN